MARLLFGFDDARCVEGWTAIDDRVMGGVSRSRLRHDPAAGAVFEGVVSLERNGGFASVRSAAGPLGLAGADDCVIEARGDGRQYKLSLFTDDAFDAVSYQAAFTQAAGRWVSVRLPIGDFKARFRGREVGDAPGLDPGRIRQVGLMIAGAQAGAFALGVRSIRLE
ncbi:MAG: CIA30 family protein [Aquincola sp.]|nr:CIA30 family protein [Aquincola sp.]